MVEAKVFFTVKYISSSFKWDKILLCTVNTCWEKIKTKERNYLENWRPISLINVDAKIASKVIAARIIKVLPEIIHTNQTGYVK